MRYKSVIGETLLAIELLCIISYNQEPQMKVEQPIFSIEKVKPQTDKLSAGSPPVRYAVETPSLLK